MKTSKVKPGDTSKTGRLSSDAPAKVSSVSTRSNSSNSSGKNTQVLKSSSTVSTAGGTSTKRYASVSDGKKQKEITARETRYSDGTTSQQVIKNNKVKEFQNSKKGERAYKKASRKIDRI